MVNKRGRRKKNSLVKQKMRSSSGAKGSDAKIPAKYLSYEKKISDTRTDVIEVRPVTSPVMDMQPSGSNNMLSFNLPNNEDYFLLSDSVYLSGLIQVDITSTDAADTFALLKPEIRRIFTILQSHRFRVGGQVVDECLNSNLNLHTLECQEQRS